MIFGGSARNVNCHTDSNTYETHKHCVDKYFSTLNVLSVCDIDIELHVGFHPLLNNFQPSGHQFCSHPKFCTWEQMVPTSTSKS